MPIIGDIEIIFPVILAKARAVEKGKFFSTSSMEQIKEKTLSWGKERVLSIALKIIPYHSQICVGFQTLFSSLGGKPALRSKDFTQIDFS